MKEGVICLSNSFVVQYVWFLSNEDCRQGFCEGVWFHVHYHKKEVYDYITTLFLLSSFVFIWVGAGGSGEGQWGIGCQTNCLVARDI